jgi:hypothetical protein
MNPHKTWLVARLRKRGYLVQRTIDAEGNVLFAHVKSPRDVLFPFPFPWSVSFTPYDSPISTEAEQNSAIERQVEKKD